MKKIEEVPAVFKKITWYCDICEEEMAENARDVCSHCGRDICSDHRKYFRKSLDRQEGSRMLGVPNISIVLCDECRLINMTYEEFLELFFEEMRIRSNRIGGMKWSGRPVPCQP